MKQGQQLTMKRMLLVMIIATALTGFEIGIASEQVTRHSPAYKWVGSFVVACMFCIMAAKYALMLLNAFRAAESGRGV